MPFFSIICQSTLKPYPGAASNRPEKLVRAIESVINQMFQDWELIVIGDNCEQTYNISKSIIDVRKTNINSFELAGKWNSFCRNIGRDRAIGKYTLYLDNDDYYSPDYLQTLFNAIQEQPATWYVVDHFEWNKTAWQLHRARLTMNSAGTANVVHVSTMRSRWPDTGTRGMEDWTFIKRLMNESKDYKHLDLAGYYVAHINGKYDV